MGGAVLVTGGAGYIGCYVVRTLLGAGRDVVVVDSASTDWAVGDAVKFRVDVRNEPGLDIAMEGVEAVVHLAGLSDVVESTADPLGYYSANVVGTLRVLEAMRRAHVKRIVLASSCVVYGRCHGSVQLSEMALTEPVSPYGRTKVAAEDLVRSYCETTDCRAVILRLFNVAGCGHGLGAGSRSRLIPRAVLVALGVQLELKVPCRKVSCQEADCGTSVRDYVHVKDVAHAFLLGLEHATPECPVYNIGTGVGHSVLEVIDRVRGATSGDVPVTVVPPRLCDPPHAVAGIARAAEIGWKPWYNIDQIISSVVESYRGEQSRRVL